MKTKFLTFNKLAVALLFFVLQTIAFNSFASNPELSEEIVKEIESSLLFDKESSQDIEIYKPTAKKEKKPDITIDRGSAKESNNIIKIDITESSDKPLNLSIIEKQRIAYNTALIEQYEVAIELYKQIIKADSSNEYAKFSLAVIYQQIGQLKQAKELYYELLRNNPSNKDEIIENLLSVLVEESPRDSVYLLSRLSSENQKSSYLKAQLALAYDKVKEYDKAIYVLKQAIEIDPSKIEYRYNLAVIYDKTANYEKALENYYYVIKNYDNSQFIPLEQIKERIESIKLNS
ncbi:MAG: tetratricopeptide repeat protein [Pelagibacterales bacterium]|nr:tetratricopeptide repeat protein [Pelagibacterales bacterium]